MSYFSLENEFIPFYKIKNNLKGRRLVIPDIHGFFDTFFELINTINFTKDDQLFLLGDFIDKGKKGKEVLDFIIKLLDDNYQIFPLRGNHEDMLLSSHFRKHDEFSLRLPVLTKTKGIRDENRKILPKYLRLIEKLPYFYELDDFLLVHAGFNFKVSKPFEDYYNMMWISEFEANREKTNGKTIIHGHKIKSLDNIIYSVSNREPVIGLDNAPMLRKNSQFGNLVCLNLNSFELIIQPNID